MVYTLFVVSLNLVMFYGWGMSSKNTIGIALLVVVLLLQHTLVLGAQPVSFSQNATQSPNMVDLAPKGYLTTPQELSQILSKANRGIEPFATNVATLIDQANNPSDWDYGTVSGEFYVSSGNCVARNSSQGENFLGATE